MVGDPHILLKDLCTQTHSLGGTHPKLQGRDSDSGGNGDIQGETKLCGCKARARGTATISSM